MTPRSRRKAAKAKAVEVPGEPGDLRRAALVLAAVWALLFAPQIFASRGFVIGDAGSIRSFAEFSSVRWHEYRQRTQWNPYIFAGLPAAVSLQDSRPQWLPDPLLDAFDGLHRLPGFPPLAIPMAIHLAGMIAMAALSRRLWSAGTLAMVWSGVAWGLLPGQLVPFAFGQDWLLMSISLMPVILLAVTRYPSAGSTDDRIAAGLGLSLVTACLFLAAHPQIIALTIPLAAVFAIERSRREQRLKALAAMAVFAALGVAMAAAIWWPAHLYNAHSVRGGEAGGVSLGEVAAWSAGLPDLVAMAWPWAAGFGSSTYWGGLHATDFPQFLGTTVLALGLLGLVHKGANPRAARLLAVAAAVSALLSLGLHLGPLYLVMYDRVPFWSSFRVAIRTLIVAQLAFALLSSRGLEHLIHAATRAPYRWRMIAAGLAGAALVIAALLQWGFLAWMYGAAVQAARPNTGTAAALEVAHRAALDLGARGLMIAALAALFAIGPRAAPAWRSAAAITLLVIDLGVVGVPFLRKATGSLDRLARPAAPPIAQLAAANPTARVLDLSHERRFSNDWIRWRAHSLTGNHPAVPRECVETWKAAAGSYGALCGLAIRYLGSGDGAPDPALFDAIGDSSSGAPLWELKGAMPRAYPVAAVARLGDEREVLAALASPEFDPHRFAFTTEDGIAGEYTGAADCRIRWLADDPDCLELESSSGFATFVVIADTWFPGWRATMDGQAIAIHRVQHMLRGLAVPPGTHRLRLDYEPEGWAAAVRWAWAAWGLWMAGVAVALWRRFGGLRSRGDRRAA